MCKATFSIGKNYKDLADCDVLKMDECHLLLGRPWQFDRFVTHNGTENTYSFQWNNKQMVLPTATKPTTNPGHKTTKGLLFSSSGTQFQKDLKSPTTIVSLIRCQRPTIQYPHRSPTSPIRILGFGSYRLSSKASTYARHST